MIMPLAAPAGPSAIVWRPSTVCQRCLRSCQPHPARDRSTMPWRPTRTRASDPQSGLLGDGAVTCGVCRPDGSGAASRRREIPMSFPTACRGTNRSADTCANRSARLGAGPAAGSGGGALRRCPGHLLAPGPSTDGGKPSYRPGAGTLTRRSRARSTRTVIPARGRLCQLCRSGPGPAPSRPRASPEPAPGPPTG